MFQSDNGSGASAIVTKIKKGETVFNLKSGDYRSNGLRWVMCLSFYVVLLFASSSFAQSKTIIDEWASVQAPKPPELKAVKIEDPKSTAYLVLEVVQQSTLTKFK